MRKLLFACLYLAFIFSCGTAPQEDENKIPQIQNVSNYRAETSVTSKLDYRNKTTDTVNYVVSSMKEFWVYHHFSQIPKGHHVYEYSIWQEGMPYYTPNGFAMKASEASEEAVEEATEEIVEESSPYPYGYYEFDVLDNKNTKNVWTKLTPKEAFIYGAGDYYFDMYIDGKLITRKEIKLLNEEEKHSGKYDAYWLSGELYSQFQPYEASEKSPDWVVTYFNGFDKNISQVIPVQYKTFNKFFMTAAYNGKYALYEITKHEKKLIREFQTSDEYQMHFKHYVEGDVLYLYNYYKRFNTKINLTNGQYEEMTEEPVIDSHEVTLLSAEGSLFLLKNGGETRVQLPPNTNINVRTWITHNYKAGKAYFNYNDDIYEYDLEKEQFHKIIFMGDVKTPVYFSNNDADFITYINDNNIMIATNELNVSGAFFMSEYHYDNKFRKTCTPISNIEDTISVSFMKSPELIHEHSAYTEMEGFYASIHKVGNVNGGTYDKADVIRIRLEDQSECKGCEESTYTSEIFTYGLVKNDSMIFLNKHFDSINTTYMSIQNNILSFGDPGFSLAKSEYLQNINFFGVSDNSVIPELAMDEFFQMDETQLKLFAYNTTKNTETNYYKQFYENTDQLLYVPNQEDDGSFHIFRKDGTHLIYTYDFTGRINVDNMNLNPDDYVPYTDRSCTGSRTDLANIKIMNESDLQKIGTYSGHDIYTDKDLNSRILHEEHKTYKEEAGQYQDADGAGIKSYDQFIQTTPVFYWKDNRGRFVRFRRKEFLRPMNCEPIMYLYPQEDTNIEVTLDDKIDLLASYPVYKKSWKLHVSKNGDITDLESKAEEHRVFWEGISDFLPALKKGFVVAQEEIEPFLDQKLAYLGLNELETKEFKEAWLGILSEKKYCFIGFYDKNIIDRYAPLTISPKPDQFIRILMDYKLLDEKIVVDPLVLEKAPERKGYTVVEWGGLKR